MQRGTKAAGKGKEDEQEYGFQNITKTFMHEGITKCYCCYAAQIGGRFIYFAVKSKDDGSPATAADIIDKLWNAVNETACLHSAVGVLIKLHYFPLCASPS